MAGVPAISFEKHLQELLLSKIYSCFNQTKGFHQMLSRYLDTVVSPGTNFDFVIDQDEKI